MAFKSRHFPGQLVASRRGSPLLVGIKSENRLMTDHFPVSFSKGKVADLENFVIVLHFDYFLHFRIDLEI